MCNHVWSFYGILLLIPLAPITTGIQDWEFNLQRIDYNISDTKMVEINLILERVSPGIYAVNGSATTTCEIDDSYSVELKVYRSATGSSDYKLTPFQVKRCSFYKFMNMFYVKMLQKDLESCSNFPQYHEKCDSPLPVANYNFNMCIITNSGMPSHLQSGYYKAVALVEGEKVSVYISALFRVEPKNMYK